MASGFEAYLSDFRPNSAGIIEVWTSDGMQAALAGSASELEGRANAEAHLSHATHGFPTPYEGGTTVLDRTAIGYVRTANMAGRADQAAHHTLDTINH